ncbi:iron complex transport system substrate-binding protein [Jatrophihabitans endophyticus]|uniref:Iron complex transport system substrate-binding protein n=1 Tax=Jatrophihabitans endophyticus TaxID=1206085 RepID=A0A1M5KZN1_9ACTN|nr:ABC transporter substrate-binding protein [Jatrophihabitans endophyticus]SHG58120.1 iron complex transport system substrate-binding protein [Jatrophihabitans endophyticus]
MRIVSLLPAATEIVYALGLADSLVGVTFECDEPAAARTDHAVVVGGRDTSGMTPAEIDAYVRAQAAAGADLYHLHRDALRTLQPDLVLSQDLCRVCALPAERVDEALAFLGCRAEVVALDPYSLDDVLATIATVARAAGVAARGDTVRAALRARLDAVATAVAGRPRPRVAVVEWVDPPFAAGHWIPDLVRAAGGEPVAATPHERSGPTTWAALAAAAPDVVVVAPCGFGLDGAAAQAATVGRELPHAAIWAVDGDGLIVRPGPRLVDGVEALAGIFHPEFARGRAESVRRVR